jgi:hypothetical protein
VEDVLEMRGKAKRRYVKGQGRITKDGRHLCKAKIGGWGKSRRRPCPRKARAHGYCHKHAKVYVYGPRAKKTSGDTPNESA